MRPTSTLPSWLTPAGLLTLGIVPALAGAARLVLLAHGGPLTADNARFLAAPWPVAIHIICTTLYCLLGAWQFWPRLRRQQPGWHRLAGRILVPCGLASALSGLWMTQFYPWPEFDGLALYLIRLVVGSAMLASLYIGFAAIRKGNVARHRVWMTRAYALGLGAGTQVFTHLPLIITPSLRSELSRTLCMAAGWAINLAVAEWLLHQPAQPSTR
ncbi:Uncharacterized membrane protein [Andreprevotia lacus DSM 23236]|jgi:uncharacterized membrane protein|uniref:Uncharacterized membrane protein n=1 Tax=Andreprevotia lacus DSM 23236 TaxID=1121001 RepID=A0A1W1XPE8_9NEIS|nr:DUF2306 domain-containing protein [Andreprevotia lacus]SMC25725.1 Uncharacterized membrane protein [Andreprevotia lacus DSM 23236]